MGSAWNNRKKHPYDKLPRWSYFLGQEKRNGCSAAWLPCKFSILWRESVFKQVCPSNYFVNYSSIHPESNPGLFRSSPCWALPVQVSELPCSGSCLCWRLGWDAKGRMLSLSDPECWDSCLRRTWSSLNLLTFSMRGRGGVWSQQGPKGSWPKNHRADAPREQHWGEIGLQRHEESVGLRLGTVGMS